MEESGWPGLPVGFKPVGPVVGPVLLQAGAAYRQARRPGIQAGP